MFCPNCGNKLNGTESFCNSCGLNLKNVIIDNSTIILESDKNIIATFKTNILKMFKLFINFIAKNKKIFSIILCSFIILIIGTFLFNAFYDFTTIEWDKKSDASLNYVDISSSLDLKVIAYDKEKNTINKIIWASNDGKIENDGTNAIWLLPNKEGTYKIAATTPSGKTITKTITVLDFEKKKDISGLLAENKLDPSDDKDNDGLSNALEEQSKTDPYLFDTDEDGLSDAYEINVSKTNPLKSDTDNDGLNDGNEIALGLNPLKNDSKGDGTTDGKRMLSYLISDKENGVDIEITGRGNIVSTTVDNYSLNIFKDIDGIVNKTFNFNTSGELKNAKVTIKYNKDDLVKANISEDNLCLYYFNEAEKKLEHVDTQVDKVNSTITVNLTHFSMYVMGDGKNLDYNIETQIMFVIDNSGSMYTKEQALKKDPTVDVDGLANDSEYKRLEITKKLINNLNGNYKFGVGKFTFSYTTLSELTNDRDKLKDTIDSIKTGKEGFDGTYIGEALYKSLDEFDSVGKIKKYIVLLTDGDDIIDIYGYDSKKMGKAINKALNLGVKIITIGLGDKVNETVLKNIANKTGGKYFYANNADALDELYNNFYSELNFDFVDTDEDKVDDGLVVADSGFVAKVDGFSFANYRTVWSNQGNCYGISTFTKLYYLHQLPLTIGEITKEGGAVIDAGGYNLKETYFESGSNNINDFKIKDVFTINDLPTDYRISKPIDGVLYLSDKYKQMHERIGSKIYIGKNEDNKSEIKEYERTLIDPSSANFKLNVNKDEQQLLYAINRFQQAQTTDEDFDFSNIPDKAFDKLRSDLSSGNPVVLSMDDKAIDFEGGHAILVTRMIIDLSDSNNIRLEIYDSNYPSIAKYIDVKRTGYKWFDYTAFGGSAYSNDYQYKFSYDGVKKEAVKINYLSLQ